MNQLKSWIESHAMALPLQLAELCKECGVSHIRVGSQVLFAAEKPNELGRWLDGKTFDVTDWTLVYNEPNKASVVDECVDLSETALVEMLEDEDVGSSEVSTDSYSRRTKK